MRRWRGRCLAVSIPMSTWRAPRESRFECALSYMGTYAADRQDKLDRLFLECARRRPELPFLLAGTLYPWHWQWPANVKRFDHVSPAEHPALYSSSRLTLNLTRAEMAACGYCPSGRFFEAAACGTPIVSDWFEGLDTFFRPGEEILIASGDRGFSSSPRPSRRRFGANERARPSAYARRAHGRASRAPDAAIISKRLSRARQREAARRGSQASRALARSPLRGHLHVVGRRGLHRDRNHSRGRRRTAHSAAWLLEGTAAGRLARGRRRRATQGRFRVPCRAHDRSRSHARFAW